MIDSHFRLREHQSSLRTEILAGATTFLTMAYIIFVQPAVLSGAMFGTETGMDFGAVTTATCVAAAVATAIMGLFARYPIALAPGMGQNFFFVISALPAAAATGASEPWRVAMGTVFVAGVVFLAISLFGIRKRLMDVVSPAMKHAIAVGIGLFIAFIGLQYAGLILTDAGTAVKMNPVLYSPDLVVFFAGFLVACTLLARGARGPILWGIAAALLTALALRWLIPVLPEPISGSRLVSESKLFTDFVPASGVLSAPPSLAPTFLGMDLLAALQPAMIPIVVMFLFMDVFDTMGTLIGVGQQAGFIKDNKLPRAERAMLSDAAGTVIGAALGTTTVTSYIESASGVQEGGRTGLTALTVSCLFLLALFFSPLIEMIGKYPPITAPALVLVGAMMVRNVKDIDWSDVTEGIPAFVTILGIPLFHSIADGLSLGLVAYPFLKLSSGRARELGWPMWGLAALLGLYFVLVRARM
ncbi:MAG: NCS2 family permease [Planctomycetota bacterium]